MATDVHSVVIETLEAPLPVGTRVSSVVIETLEAPLPVGTRVSSVVIETLEVPLPVGTRVSSVVIGALEDYRVIESGGGMVGQNLVDYPGLVGSNVWVNQPQ